MHHIVSDPEQYLFDQCIHEDKTGEVRCTEPAWISHETCQKHTALESSKTKHLVAGIDIAKKAKQARKRKLEQSKIEKKEVKKETLHRSTRRSSKNREDSHISGDVFHPGQSIQIHSVSDTSHIGLSSSNTVKLEDISNVIIQNVQNEPKLDVGTAKVIQIEAVNNMNIPEKFDDE